MGLFRRNKPPVEQRVQQHEDGSQTVTTEFTLEGPPRPVESEVVECFDRALAALGGQVMHAYDPSRLLSFEAGGPPIWSVGMVEVPGPRPYTLLLTYGFSHELSPEPARAEFHHEYSLAVPAGVPLSPWADALLRHQCRYVLTEGAEIRVGDCVPLRGVPMTRVPFQPEHHAALPDSTLVGILAARDPALGRILTPAGEVEVRRLVGIDSRELDRSETWSFRGFLEELVKIDPLLLSPPMRACHLDDPDFRRIVDGRAAAEGSDVDAALFELRWEPTASGALLHLPRGQAARRLLDALQGRLGFGRRLVAFSMAAPPVVFTPGPHEVRITPRALELSGDLAGGALLALLAALRDGRSTLDLR